jgi:hypothetical protein
MPLPLPTSLSPSNDRFADLKVIVGYFSTLKNFSPLTTGSSRSLYVRIDAASIVTSIVPISAGRSRTILPVALPKLPCCVEKPIWPAAHCGCECVGSMT